ncbi:MAG: hypothetical protein QM783_16860 [Phycisphaerales bacterium]
MQINGNNQAALLARAYGSGAVTAPRQAGVVAKIAPTVPAAPADKVEVKQRAPALDALVGAVVPGKVEFSGDTAKPSQAGLGAGGTYQMFRRPTDRMEAATAVSVGRRIDVQG